MIDYNELWKRLPQSEIILIDRSLEIAEEIRNLMNEKGINQKDLAEKLGKKESEVSKYLSGSHNFTLGTLSKIEAVLGKRIFYTRAGLDILEDSILIIAPKAPKDVVKLNYADNVSESEPVACLAI